jgi:hypothetical protein
MAQSFGDNVVSLVSSSSSSSASLGGKELLNIRNSCLEMLISTASISKARFVVPL